MEQRRPQRWECMVTHWGSVHSPPSYWVGIQACTHPSPFLPHVSSREQGWASKTQTSLGHHSSIIYLSSLYCFQNEWPVARSIALPPIHTILHSSANFQQKLPSLQGFWMHCSILLAWKSFFASTLLPCQAWALLDSPGEGLFVWWDLLTVFLQCVMVQLFIYSTISFWALTTCQELCTMLGYGREHRGPGPMSGKLQCLGKQH